MATVLILISRKSRWELMILVVLGKTWRQKRRKKVKRENLGEGESRGLGVGVLDYRL